MFTQQSEPWQQQQQQTHLAEQQQEQRRTLELSQLDLFMEVEEVPPSMIRGRDEEEEENGKYIKKERKAGRGRAEKVLLDAKPDSLRLRQQEPAAAATTNYQTRQGVFLLLLLGLRRRLLSPQPIYCGKKKKALPKRRKYLPG